MGLRSALVAPSGSYVAVGPMRLLPFDMYRVYPKGYTEVSGCFQVETIIRRGVYFQKLKKPPPLESSVPEIRVHKRRHGRSGSRTPCPRSRDQNARIDRQPAKTLWNRATSHHG